MTPSDKPLRIVVSDFQVLTQATGTRVVVFTERAQLSRRVSRALRALSTPLVMCDTMESAVEVLSTGTVSLFIYQPRSATDPHALANARKLAGYAPMMLLVDSLEHQWFTEVLGEGPNRQSVASVIGAWADGDLLRTARKILENNAFGVEKYLNWGAAVHSHRLGGSNDKVAVLNHFARFLEDLRCPEQLRMRAMTVADEYLMNALYDAPTDAQGKHLYTERSRTEPVQLEPNKAATFEYGADGQNMVLGCRDLFGSFDVQKGMRSLGRCFKGDGDQIAQGSGGAGLGLYVTYNYVDHLVINLAPGISTELLAVIHMGASTGSPHRGKSVNLFISAAPTSTPDGRG